MGKSTQITKKPASLKIVTKSLKKPVVPRKNVILQRTKS